MPITDLMRREDNRGRLVQKMYGTVSSWDSKNCVAKVSFDTDLDTNGNPRISGWLPIKVDSAGAGMKMLFAPTPGDQCVVDYPEGDQEAGHISGFTHNDIDTPPGPLQSGEGIMQNSQGNNVRFNSDGSIQVFHKSTGNYAKVDKNGNIVNYLSSTSQQHYLGGDPAMGGTFLPVKLADDSVSPYAQARKS